MPFSEIVPILAECRKIYLDILNKNTLHMSEKGYAILKANVRIELSLEGMN